MFAVIACFALLAACSSNDSTTEGDCSRIEVLVGFGIGGGSDTFARQLAMPLEEYLGIPVQVLNITAGGGIGAYRELLARPPDGCTMLVVSSDYSVHAVYEPETVDLAALRFLVRAHAEAGLLVRASGSNESWPELLARVSSEQRSLRVGGSGARSFDRAAISVALAGIEQPYRYIPYGGAREMQADLLGGRLDAMYEEYGSLKALLDAGEVEPMLTLAEQRIEVLPATPAAGELGLKAAPRIWRGIAVDRRIADPQAERLRSALSIALADPRYVEYERSRSLASADGRVSDPQFFESAVRRETEAFSQALTSHD